MRNNENEVTLKKIKHFKSFIAFINLSVIKFKCMCENIGVCFSVHRVSFAGQLIPHPSHTPAPLVTKVFFRFYSSILGCPHPPSLACLALLIHQGRGSHSRVSASPASPTTCCKYTMWSSPDMLNSYCGAGWCISI